MFPSNPAQHACQDLMSFENSELSMISRVVPVVPAVHEVGDMARNRMQGRLTTIILCICSLRKYGKLAKIDPTPCCYCSSMAKCFRDSV